MRVLVIAEAANPEWVSIPLEGWSHSEALRRVADVHLVTQIRNRDAIRRAGLDDDCFTAVDTERLARPLCRLSQVLRGGGGKGWTIQTAIETFGYYYFEHLVWQAFGKPIAAGEFDIVHRIVPLSPTTPSLLAAKCAAAGVPFVMGPLNGGVPWPRAFDAARRREREWLSYIRAAHKLMPGYRRTRRNAAAIIIGSRDTWEQMPRRYHDKCVYIPENAVDPERFSRCRTRTASLPLRLVFVGRLVPYKGADMLLEAAAPLIRAGEAVVEIIGDGPQMGELKAFVDRAEIAGGVTFAGWVQHEKVQNHLIESDLFVFPSIREFGGAVVLEAMGVGLVPMVVDYGGPGELVTRNTGFAVPLGDRGSIVLALRRALMQLVDQPWLIDQRSEAARRRVLSQFTWDAKARQVIEVYEWVLGRRSAKPDFGMPLADAQVPIGPSTALIGEPLLLKH
jgi:glycosyltransferase involved in cell wall biosynthesis